MSSTQSDLSVSRRTLSALFLAGLGSPLVPALDLLAQGTSSNPRPFRIEVPQATIDRILSGVRDAQWPDRLDSSDWRYGTNWDYMRALAKYWVEQFDWRKAEANLNRYPQFLARVGDYEIHFYHVKGRGPKPMPDPHAWLAGLSI